MRQKVIELKLSKAVLKRIDELSGGVPEDRGAMIKELVRIGLAHVRREQAAEQHVSGQITLSAAARQARLTAGAMKQYLLSRADNLVLQLKGWDAIQRASDDSALPAVQDATTASDEHRRGRIEWHNGEPLYVFEITYNRYHFDPTYPKDPKTFGERIRKARMDKMWMVKQLARRLGVTPDTVINWDLHNRKPMPQQAKRLRAVLGVEVESGQSSLRP